MTLNRSFIQDAILGLEVKAALHAFLDRFEPVTVEDATYTFASKPYDNKSIKLARAAGSVVTLPPATGSRAKYRFIVSTAVTTPSTKIQVTGTDVMIGNIIANSTGDTPDLAQPWPTAATSDTITLNGTTSGGVGGDVIDLEDIGAGLWHVSGVTVASGVEISPFSAAVS